MRFHLSLPKNWWVIAFTLMAGAVYIQAIHKKNRLVATLQGRIDTFTREKMDAMEREKELLLRINSQNYPDFVELVLKEKLGVAAEGELKVVFQ